MNSPSGTGKTMAADIIARELSVSSYKIDLPRYGAYAQRPIPCRGYDCRTDTRIWLDFEARIVNPLINDPEVLGGLASASIPKNTSKAR